MIVSDFPKLSESEVLQIVRAISAINAAGVLKRGELSQIAEIAPGAARMAQECINMPPGEFWEAIRAETIHSQDVMPKFTDALCDRYGVDFRDSGAVYQ